ncbi:unnamed protein product [Caenorhabditis angaria]|uniref:Uncharacterized protein n=1 Tax=Caenorhabditis angaria TaxID=860376 RepID=A0A9P1IDG5_9PELO|nr:unnamed protein product [Caenorhabditis angaria]
MEGVIPLIIWLFTAPYQSNLDHFVFDIPITCRLPVDRFTYKIQFFENDVFSNRDVLTRAFNETIGPMPVYRKFVGQLGGDEIFSAGYSISADIEHDCTNDRKPVKARIIFKQLCRLGKWCNLAYDLNLTNLKGFHKQDAVITK